MSIELHRDVRNWSRTICTVLVFLEDTKPRERLHKVIPGIRLLPDVALRLIAEHDPWWIASGLLEQRISIPMPAGGMLAIDSMLQHAAGRNGTDGTRTRMTLTAGYHALDHHAGVRDPKRVVVCGERVYQGNAVKRPASTKRR